MIGQNLNILHNEYEKESERMNEKTFSPWAKERGERIKEILEYVKTQNPAKFSELIGIFGVKWGLREKTIESYVNQLEMAGLVKIDRYEGIVKAIE